MEYFVNPLTNGHMKTSQLLRVLPKSVVRAIERRSQRLPRRAAETLFLQVGGRLRKPL